MLCMEFVFDRLIHSILLASSPRIDLRNMTNIPSNSILSPMLPPSMLHGADLESLHCTPDFLMLDVQHPSPRFEHPGPPHLPQESGQHVSEAS